MSDEETTRTAPQDSLRDHRRQQPLPSRRAAEALGRRRTGTLAPPLARARSRRALDSGLARAPTTASSRRSNESISLDDSMALRLLQETEEDVCFPMVPDHVRINGIDFDEFDEFVQEEREKNVRVRVLELGEPELSAKVRYTPRGLSNELVNEKATTASSKDVHFGLPVHHDDIPDRFSFFRSELEGETLHAPDLPLLIPHGQLAREFFAGGIATWWLDCVCANDDEIKMLAKAFGIHPLTAEDIRMKEDREKVELFRNYYFVAFHTLDTDPESDEFLEPINFYIVVFRDGILTFHFSPVLHPASVRRRVRQLRDYVDVSADWLCYALIDDITDGFAPVITLIEHEADAIEDLVFVARQQDFSPMLHRIGDARRRVMTLMRLLTNKADVIRMFAKRCKEDDVGQSMAALSGSADLPTVQPRGEIALYLGDIQDHVITMSLNLGAYEKIFLRSHANYLAQLQVESFNSNNRINDMLSKVTLVGTVIVPLNIVTGLFGMNVTIPGESQGNLRWFFGIVGMLVFIVLLSVTLANWWLKWLVRDDSGGRKEGDRSVFLMPLSGKRQARAHSILSTPSKRFAGYV